MVTGTIRPRSAARAQTAQHLRSLGTGRVPRAWHRPSVTCDPSDHPVPGTPYSDEAQLALSCPAPGWALVDMDNHTIEAHSL